MYLRNLFLDGVSQMPKYRKDGDYIMNVGILIIAIIGGVVGILSTLFLTFSFPAVIIWKIYRRIAHGIPVTK